MDGVGAEDALLLQVRIDLGAGLGGRIGKGRITLMGRLYWRMAGLPPIASRLALVKADATALSASRLGRPQAAAPAVISLSASAWFRPASRNWQAAANDSSFLDPSLTSPARNFSVLCGKRLINLRLELSGIPSSRAVSCR